MALRWDKYPRLVPLLVRLEKYYGQGWGGKQDGMRLPLPRSWFGGQAAGVSHITAAIIGRVAVQQLAVKSWRGHTHAIAFPRYRREISQHHHEVVGILGAADERDDTVVHIVKVDPLKTFPTEVHLVQRGLLDIQLVECLHILLQITMRDETQELEVELPCVIPLAPLSDLAAHEEELLAGMGVHVAV